MEPEVQPEVAVEESTNPAGEGRTVEEAAQAAIADGSSVEPEVA